MKVTVEYRKRKHVLKMHARNMDEYYDPCSVCSLKRSCSGQSNAAYMINCLCSGTGYGFKEVKDDKK